MNGATRQTRRPLWLGLGLTALLLGLMVATFKWQAAQGTPLPVFGQVADFALTNQEGRAVSLADLRGRVWVADIIFTRCAGPCLKMSRQMKELQEALPASSEAKLVTLTTDPEFDSPAVLKKYGSRFSADPDRWVFLTGTKPQLARLAGDSLKLAAVEKKPEERETPVDLFIHSTIFVLVDKQGQLRGVFQTGGEGIDPEQVKKQLLASVRQLERER